MTFLFLWAIWSLVSYFVVQIVSYERVSELMMRGLGFRRKPSGMYNYLQREDWFRTLQYHQFTMDEMANGSAYNILKNLYIENYPELF